MHDKISQEQAKLATGAVSYTEASLKKWAGQIGLNAGQFNACLDSQKYASRVNGDQENGTKLGVNGTPAFFINGNRLIGAQPFASFQALIEEEL